MKRGFIGAVTACVLLLGSVIAAPVAHGGGNGATTGTMHFHDATTVLQSGDPAAVNPCSGAPGTLTLTYNGVLHFTTNANGFWFTTTMTGDFSFVPDDPTQPSYTGHFTSWDGESSNPNIDVQHSTLNLHGTGSDGSSIQFHENFHLNTTSAGVTLAFDKARCG